jgi:poly(A) polymerase
VDPVVIPRAEHPISRKNVDPDALRVLYRLHASNFSAYLVGGSVRDLMLGRQPKDFDIGTDAHPHQIKRLFRNCWIIGRRFRLAHVKFGNKTIEVATFRKQVPETPADAAPPDESIVVASAAPEPETPTQTGDQAGTAGGHHGHAQIHRDNTFGTPEEDAFRRDFTINGLFYDIATYSVIDYVGGLEDLQRRVIRSIGDPHVRFVEDPVRMLRAAVFGARLGFDLDALVIEAIAEHRGLILKASPSRMIEEYYKILRSGFAEASFRALGRLRLLELITPELKSPPDAVWDSLARLDQYRQRFASAPPELTNAVLIGALLMPLKLLDRPPALVEGATDRQHDRVSFGVLPVAKKDLERLRHVRQMLPRLNASDLPPRVVRGMIHRPSFDDALTWMEVFDGDPDVIERWRQARSQRAAHPPAHPHGHGQPHRQPQTHHPPQSHGGHHQGDQRAQGEGAGRRRRRRRRRRRGRGGGSGSAAAS